MGAAPGVGTEDSSGAAAGSWRLAVFKTLGLVVWAPLTKPSLRASVRSPAF